MNKNIIKKTVIAIASIASLYSQEPDKQQNITSDLKRITIQEHNLEEFLLSHYNNNPYYNLEFIQGPPSWKINLVELGFKYFNPVFLPDKIVLINEERVVAINSFNGKILWDKNLEKSPDKLTVIDDVIYWTSSYKGPRLGPFAGHNTWLRAYSIKEDKEIWKTDLTNGHFLNYFDKHLYRFGGSVFGNLSLFSYDLSGKIEWEYKAKGGNDPYFTKDLIIFSPGADKKLIGLDRKTGKEVFLYKLDDITGITTIYENIFYTSKQTSWAKVSEVIPINLETGKQLWKFKSSSASDYFIGITANKDYCAFLTSNFLYVLDASNGTMKYIIYPENDKKFLNTKPIILNDKIVVAHIKKNKESTINIYNIKDGTQITSLNLEDELLPPLKIVGETLFMCFRHGDMLAIPLKKLSN